MEKEKEKNKLLEEFCENSRILNDNNIFDENIDSLYPETKDTQILITTNSTNINQEGKTISIRRFGNQIKQFSLTSKKEFINEVNIFLLFPLYKENGKFVPLSSYSEIKKSKKNHIILEEGIDINYFNENKFKNVIYYLGINAAEGPYLYDYKYLTLNYLIYFPFLKKDNIFNKVFNNGTYISQIEEDCSKFEVLVRKYFLYGGKAYKFFIGPDKIGKTSLIHQIIHHNFLHEKGYPNVGYGYIDLSLFYNKILNQKDIYTIFNDCYFMFFDYTEYINFINDYSKFINKDSLSNIFKIIKNMIKYIFDKYKDTQVTITIILDNIKKEMKNKIEELIELSDKLFNESKKLEPPIKLFFCGNFNFGEINSQKITKLIKSDSNLDEYSSYHVIFDSSYKIPKDKLNISQQEIMEQLNYELSSYHQYYDIISKNINTKDKIQFIKQEIKNDLNKYDINYIFLSNLLIEKCKIQKENFIDEEMRYLIDEQQENNILENLPWAYYRIKKNDTNITGYDIIYKDNIIKEVIEKIIEDYFTELNFDKYEKNKPNSIFGYFFEQFLIHKFKNSMQFLNYKIEDIIIVNSIYSNNNWEFINKCNISSFKCYLILQDLINAPYFDLALLIPYGDNFFIILIQVTVNKSSSKLKLLTVECNYQRFLKIKEIFEKEFYPFKLIDGDFVFLIFEERDKNTIDFCIDNCIKCISYFKEKDNFRYWKDDLSSIIIDEFPTDSFTIVNCISNKQKLLSRKENIKKAKEKNLLNLYNINPKTKKKKPIINLTQKEKNAIISKIKGIYKDAITVSLTFIENENDINAYPLEKEVLVYLIIKDSKKIKIGFELYNNNNKEIKFYKFNNNINLGKSESTYSQRYSFKYTKFLIGHKNKRNLTK